MRDFREPLLHKDPHDGVCAVFVTMSAMLGGLALCLVLAFIAWPK